MNEHEGLFCKTGVLWNNRQNRPEEKNMTWAKTALGPIVQKVGAAGLTLGLARWVERGSRAKWAGDTLGLDDAKGAAHTHQRSSSPLE